MPNLSEDQKQAIKDLRNYGFSINATNEATGIARQTVSKHEPEDVEGYDEDLEKTSENYLAALSPTVDPQEVLLAEHLPDEIRYAGVDQLTGDSTGNEAVTGEDDEEKLVHSDPSNLSPGDFIEELFENFEVGVKKKFVTLQAKRANRRDELPDKDKMAHDLKNMSSGVSNDTEVQYISEEYWDEAQKYLAETGTRAFRQGNDGGGFGSSQGSYVSPNGGQQAAGQWVQFPDGQMRYGQWTEGPNGNQIFREMQPPGGGRGGGGRGGGGRDDDLREEVRQLRQELRQQSQQNSGPESLTEMVGQVQQIRQTLNELDGDDGGSENNENIRVLQQELRQLRQEMSNEASQMQGGSPKEMLLQRVIQDNSADMNDVISAFDKLEGEQNPEVRKAEIERDLEEQKMQQRSETTRQVLTGLQDVMESMGKGIGNAIREGNDEGQSGNSSVNIQSPSEQQSPAEEATPRGDGGSQMYETTGSQETQSQAATQASLVEEGVQEQMTMETKQWECPNCATETTTDAQTVGVECPECDFSIAPCPDCEMPIEIPPEDELERGGCPDCGSAVMDPVEEGDDAYCPNCSWMGDESEAFGDKIECDYCGEEAPIWGSA